AQARQATPFMMLLASFMALLHRYTRQQDIRIGVPSANRRLSQVQGVVGFFVNTLVLRGQLRPRASFTEILAAAKAATIAAQANQELPIDQLAAQRTTQDGKAVDQPLFTVLFNHQQRHLSALGQLPGLEVEELPWYSREAKCDLQLQTEEDGQGRLSLHLDYAETLFDAAAAARIAAQFLALLRQVAADPRLAIGELQLATADERNTLLQWGQAPRASGLRVLPELLAERMQAQRERIALAWDGGSLHYGELHDASNRLAHCLRARGVGPDVCVAVLIDRSPQLLIALLAILKAGGAYLPLDGSHPPARLREMIADCAAPVLLTRGEAPADLRATIDVVALDTLDLDAWPDQTPQIALHGDSLAYVLHTSGSTGRPKGVAVSHAAVSARLAWMQHTYRLDENDVLLQKAPLTFDVSVWECFWPLLAGATLVLAAPGEHRDPRRLVELAAQHRVTVLHFVPSLLQQFIAESGVSACGSLRYLFSGGETLSAALRDDVLAKLPGVVLHNRYGPTESTINATYWQCGTEDGERAPIGRPLGDTVCRVLDGELNLLPAGVPGELCIGGAGLARGYQGNAAQTALRFVPDAFADEGAAGARLYRSGDLARWQHDGALEFLGRLDHQVKLRGLRIEPGEIEARLRALDGVAQAAVRVHTAANGSRQLIGYFTVQDAQAPEPEQLQAALRQVLPDYMVPAQLLALDAMPLTPSGKLDYRQLPEPVLKTRAYRAPVAELERKVADIWQTVLAVTRVGLEDDFFALGGHSLLATQIVARTRQHCDVDLPLRTLFEASRLADYVEQVRQLQRAGAINRQPPIELIDRSQPVPLAHSQQRLWFLWQLEPDSPAYNVGGMARFRGALDADVLEAALDALIQRHETLRTTFPDVGGVPVQQVTERTAFMLQRHDVSHLQPQARQEWLQTLADAQAHQPFDLVHGPLLRACLVRFSPQEHYFVLTLHHIVTEGWAMDIFARELAALYEAFLADQPSPLPPLPVQYLDYSVWQHRWLDAGEGARQLAYWRQQLGDEHPLLALPSDRPRPPIQSHRGGLYRFDLDDALAVRVDAFNAAHGTTLFMTAVTALAILLYRYSGQSDLRIGAPVANRIRPESEGLIGAFLNTQVLRCRLSGEMTVEALLAQVRQTVIDGQSHQDLPFDQLVDALQPPRSAAYNPLFQVMCNVQRWQFQQTRELAEMTVDYLVNDARAIKFDLNLEVTALDGCMRCCLTYSTDLFDEPRVAAMAAHWRNLLAALLTEPSRPVAELAMFDTDERHQLVHHLDPTPATIPARHAMAGLPVHRWFSQQAAATPEAPALIVEGETCRYGELERRANQLAHRLRELGVTTERRVGLAMERSIDMVVGLLAILKAGAAYVPLDPDYPPERLHYMIEDSGLMLLLGHRRFFATAGALPDGIGRWCVEDEAVLLQDYPADAPKDLTLPRHQAYVIYTSGSTGRPKGVVVDHAALGMHCRAVIERFGMTAADCELHFYSINFDAATERLLTPLLCGASVVLRAQGQWAVEEIAPLIPAHAVTILGFTPSYGAQLAQWVNHNANSSEELAPWRVRLCITGGEALTGEHWQVIQQTFQPACFVNAYGPTESVVMPLAADVVAPPQPGAASLPIGRMVGERVAYILDENLQPVPPGAIGELYTGGEGLARGYHARPALSAERFVPNPFAGDYGAEPGVERLYRTGDLVRLNGDGLVEYVGRRDDQIKLRGFRIELGEIEACLLALPDVREAAVLALEHEGHLQLVAYVAPGGDAARSADDLKAAIKTQLQRQLPDYMVPTQLLLLDRLPLMPNGKLDRKALPAPEAAWQQRYAQPRSDLERALAAIWESVLNVNGVGLDHNFFELGGDSILSIQVVSRARQQGIHFKPRDLFQHQTIRALATVATTAEAEQAPHPAAQEPLAGPVLLAPIQHWFFATGVPHPQHWNQALWLEVDEFLDAALLEQALQRVVLHHDSLRLAFSQHGGHWLAQYRAPDTAPAGPLLRIERVKTLSRIARKHCLALQHGMDLTEGPLLRGLLCEAPNGRQRLLLAIHHLAVDGVSWRILLEDLQRGYRQLQAGEPVRLPAKTSAFGEWTARLHAYAASAALPTALAWWQHYLGAAARVDQAAEPAAFPCDFPAGGNLERYAATVTLRLSRERTQALLQRAPQAYRTQVNDLLLTGLSRTLCAWTGQGSTLLQVESHGRDVLADDLDLTRTTGWFTTPYPLCLTPGAEELGASIKAVKEQLRAVQPHAANYGILRYLADETTRQAMAGLPEARLTFNYLGQTDQGAAPENLFHLADTPVADKRDPAAPLPNWISLDAQVQRGELSVHWTYSAARYRDATIAKLADAYQQVLEDLIDHCLAHGVAGVTPSDFPLAHLSQAQLDALAVPATAIEDIYPLTPMQEGLLLHTLLEPGTGIYYMQDRYRIDSPLNSECFTEAWQAVAARHEVLRTSFNWNAGEAMVQVVHKQYPVPVDHLDWRDAFEEDNEQRLQHLLKTEREAGFDLLNAPPFHLRLIRVAEARYWFIMSNHHILIDAWCRSLLMQDFFVIYGALLAGEPVPVLPTPPRYRDYIAWLIGQDPEVSRQWWRHNLRGFGGATPIASDRPLLREHAGDSGGMVVGDCHSHLSVADTRRLQELARQRQLTVNTFAQGAWALMLKRLSGQGDVLFGVTVAGRPAHLPDLQRTVGLFINSIPLRVAVPMAREGAVGDWLRNLLAHNLELRDHEHLSLVDIQDCSELPKGEPLFDSLFVFENAPVEIDVLDRARAFNASADSGRTHTNFPLTAVCYPGERLGLHLSYDQRYFERETIEAMLGEFQRLLLALVDGIDQPVAAVPLVSEDEKQFLMHACNRSQRDYPLHSYVHLFEAQVVRHGARIAASCRDRTWTYGELNRQANRLGHCLLGLDAVQDRPIALLAERDLPLLGMMIGTFKAGAGYLPLDPGHPPQRLADMLRTSGAPVLVCTAPQAALAATLLERCGATPRPRLLVWEDVQQDEAAARDGNPGRYGGGNDLAYVIYTSGSTGRPKGVMVSQRGMLNNQLSKVPYLTLTGRDVIAQTASQCFDISVWQFLAAPLFSARVAIIPDESSRDPGALLAQLAAERITVLESVPSLIKGLLDEDEVALPHLRWLLTTGEAMPPPLARQWLERHPAIGLVNAYGPAECSDDVAFFTVTREHTGNS
ncbi:MAG TPA: non-ribosomal peptide synthase/polyketide synthase, partial [Hyphomicrobiales bacterium]|nr:non-ribosomal peptide synthase/polyketide synthase [Hyphomicrobiales bacterium]